MKIMKKHSQRTRDQIKIRNELAKEYDRKLEFKTQEIKSECLKEVVELRSKNNQQRKDYLIEVKQIKNESDAKSKRLDVMINEYSGKNAALQEQINKVNHIGGLLSEMLSKYSANLYQERKLAADIKDDIHTIENAINSVNKLRLVK